VHPVFPIIGKGMFLGQYRSLYMNPHVCPGKRWLAILNLVFAIAANRRKGRDWPHPWKMKSVVQHVPRLPLKTKTGSHNRQRLLIDSSPRAMLWLPSVMHSRPSPSRLPERFLTHTIGNSVQPNDRSDIQANSRKSI
jgi:hypothetical protein